MSEGPESENEKPQEMTTAPDAPHPRRSKSARGPAKKGLWTWWRELDFPSKVIAPLLVIGITTAASGVAAKIAGDTTAERYQRRINSAPQTYIEELDRLIRRAVGEGKERAVLNARAIVSVRNSLRSSLVGISAQMNSDIDRLAFEIGEATVRPAPPTVWNNFRLGDAEAAYTTILVLERTWPAKRVQIEVEVRKMLTELGLAPTNAPPVVGEVGR